MSGAAGAPAAPDGAPVAVVPADSAASGSRKANGANGTNGGKKQRILWDSDSATRGGKTSIAVLLEWLTAPGNYARWRSGKSQSGETREALCSQIKAQMQRHGIAHRENANIRTQISELERSYEAARAWMAARGCAADALRSGSEEDDHGAPAGGRSAVEAAVLRLCRYFHVLDPIMRQAGDDAGARAKRPYAPRKRRERDGDDQAAARPPADAASSHEAPATPARTPKSDAAASTPLGSLSVPDLSALPMAMGSVPVAAPGLFAPWGSPALLTGLEETKRLFVEAAREERERRRRQFEWDEQRARLERERLWLDLEAARLRVATERAVARRRMEDARVPAAEIDRVLASASAGAGAQ